MSRQQPSWLADRNPVSDRAHIEKCPLCKQTVVRALVGRVAALDVRANPQPLDLAAELAARLAGRTTYCLTREPYVPARLLHRDRWHIAAGHCTHLVLAEHRCPAPAIPAGHIQEELPL